MHTKFAFYFMNNKVVYLCHITLYTSAYLENSLTPLKIRSRDLSFHSPTLYPVTDVTGQDKVTARTFFRLRCTSFHVHSPLLAFFLCFIVLVQSCCSHAQVFRKTIVHEFLIFYSHT